MQFIIDFKQDASNLDVTNYLTLFECTVIAEYDSFNNVYLVSTDNEPPVTGIVESIIRDDDSPLQLLSYPVIQGDKYPKLTFSTSSDDDWWKIAVCGDVDQMQQTATIERRGSPAVIYIVDSGIKLDHSEFEFADIENLYSFNNNFDDFNGHGTALASVLVGKTCGLTSAKIKSVKIFEAGTPTLQSDLLNAFDAILVDYASNLNTVPMVNLSWAIAKNQYIENKIQTLLDAGIKVVVAAGNNGTPIQDTTPASMLNVCTVGAFDRNLAPCNFSNYTSDISNTEHEVNYGELDVWAPGENIRIALLDGTIGVGSGTSLSSAIHIGSIAYNSFSCVYSDGSIAGKSNSTTDDILHRINLLTLDDKYADSVNAISFYKTNYQGDNATFYGRYFGFIIVVHSDELVEHLLFDPLINNSYSFSGPLPGSLIIDNGWLTGTMSSETFQVIDITVDYEYIDGEIETLPIKFIVIPANETIDNAPIDEELKISLMGLGGCGNPVQHPDTLWYCDPTVCQTTKTCGNVCGGQGLKSPGGMVCGCIGYNSCP